MESELEQKRKRKPKIEVEAELTLRWLQIDPMQRIEHPSSIDMGCNIFLVAQQKIDGKWKDIRVEQD
jgi:hypothetical protein